MSKSNKVRHGIGCKHWKDDVLASKHQKEALTKKKRRIARAERRTGKTPDKERVLGTKRIMLPQIDEE